MTSQAKPTAGLRIHKYFTSGILTGPIVKVSPPMLSPSPQNPRRAAGRPIPRLVYGGAARVHKLRIVRLPGLHANQAVAMREQHAASLRCCCAALQRVEFGCCCSSGQHAKPPFRAVLRDSNIQILLELANRPCETKPWANTISKSYIRICTAAPPYS